MRTVGIGIQRFEDLIENHLFYVDKTGFISRWYEKNDSVTLITRPRRFGKTLTLDMLNCFFSTEYSGKSGLFQGLAISQNQSLMEIQGTVPVINISFSSIKAVSFRQFLLNLSDLTASVFDRYRYLLERDFLSPDDRELFLTLNRKNRIPPDPQTEQGKYLSYINTLEKSLIWLSGWLSSFHGKKIFLFMDEYDTPIQAAWLNHYYDEAMEIMRELFSESLKNNTYLKRAVITGITRIAKESLFSDLNNLAVYSLVSGGYDDAFGFTKQEMQDILREYQLEQREAEVRFWYDGFTVGKNTEVYNPWSVTCFLAKRDNPPEDYWAQSGGMGLVDYLIRKGDPGLHEMIQELMKGETVDAELSEDLIFPDLSGDDAAVCSLLVSTGYLKPSREQKRKNYQQEEPSLYSHKHASGITALEINDQGLMRLSLTLTNYEAVLSFRRMARRWFRKGSVDFMHQFARALLDNNLSEMNRQISQVVLLTVSGFDSGVKPSDGTIQPENYFHGLTTGLLLCLMGKYSLTSNRESGFGRYDLCLEPLREEDNCDAYILEFKVFDDKKGDRTLKDTAVRAKKQITDKRYDAQLIARGWQAEHIRRYGLGFRGKEVLIV